MADQQFKTLVEDDDLEIVTAVKPKLRIEVDTDKLGINDVLFLMNLRSDKLSEQEVLQQFLPIIDRCLVGKTTADLPVRALQSVFQTVVKGLDQIGTKTKNSSGASQPASGQQEPAEK